MRANVLFSLLLVAGTVSGAEAPLPKITDIVQKEGTLAFTDGSSIYQFHSSGTFILEPNGLCGRTIQGIWKTEDANLIAVTGKWEWVNGEFRNDDFRTMTLQISLRSDKSENLKEPGPRKAVKVYPVYFTIEKLIQIPKEEYEKETRADRQVKHDASDEPLIPAPLNQVLRHIKPGMRGAEAEAQLATAYPKVQAFLGEWSGQSGYVDFRLDDRYRISFAAHNPPSGSPSEKDAILGNNLRTYIFDHQRRHRLEISHYPWDVSTDVKPQSENP